MLQNKQNILLLIVVVLISYNIFSIRSIKTDVKNYKSQIEHLTTLVDSAQNISKGIDTKVDSVKGQVISITKEINHIDNSITIIKKQTDEKVNSVDHLTANELEQFFTDRYNKNSN